MDTYEVLSKVFPVFVLFLLGYIFKRKGFFSPGTARELKKLVANITLPALLFRAFMSMELDGGRILLALMMIGISAVLLLGARMVLTLLGKKDDIRAYMVSGFEAGMLGYALFLSVFGDKSLPDFASVDLGQVLFVFIVLMPILIARSRGNTAGPGAFREALRNGLTSPVIWALVGGLVLGSLGRVFNISPEPFAPVAGFLEMLGNLTVPVIALAIGYELSFQRDIMGKALVFVAIRKVILLGLALLLMRFLPVQDMMIRFAFMTMLLLPPPFVVTLAARDEEQSLVSGILSVSTVVSIPAFALAMLLMG